jgi:polyisoprenoid-binding protein YceI
MSETMQAKPVEGTRTVEGISAPAAGTWQIDLAHTEVGFHARHMMISKVRGRFHQVSGTVVVGEDPRESRVEIEVDAASIDTGMPQRDEHLRSPDFLDVARFPTLRFVSTGVELTGGNEFELRGDLTIRDVTRPVTLQVEFVGMDPSFGGTAHAGFTARTEIDREDFGMTWNVALEAGGWLVARKVVIEIEAEITRSGSVDQAA